MQVSSYNLFLMEAGPFALKEKNARFLPKRIMIFFAYSAFNINNCHEYFLTYSFFCPLNCIQIYKMSARGSESSSLSYSPAPRNRSKEPENDKERKGQARKLRSRKRNTMARGKSEKIEHPAESISNSQKQTKLTEMWKVTHLFSETKAKANLSNREFMKKQIEEDIQARDKVIEKLRKDRQELQKCCSKVIKDKQNYEEKALSIIKQNLLQIAKKKRLERTEIIPEYGYFKESTFIEGAYLKNLKNQILNKAKQIQTIRSQIATKSHDKETLHFKQRYFQKQLDEMNSQFRERQKIVQAYKEKLKFADKQNNSFYAKLDWPVVSERFQTLQLLGSGGFGEVYKCYDLKQNCYVALKQNRFSSVGSRAEEQRAQFLKHVNREVNIQRTLNHPNIIKIIDVISMSSSEVSFVLEYCSGPQLSKYLRKHQCLQEKEAKEIIRQIIFGLKYLYQLDNKIIHYDLKPSNIMFHHGIIKILDFGLCKQMDSQDTRIDLTSQGVGTYWYLPPETFRDFDNEVSSKVDVWSVGVIFFQLLYGKRPFGHGISQAKIFNQGIILRAIKVDFPDQTPLKYKVSESAKKFIKACLKYDQNQRLSPIEAYNHPYFN